MMLAGGMVVLVLGILEQVSCWGPVSQYSFSHSHRRLGGFSGVRGVRFPIVRTSGLLSPATAAKFPPPFSSLPATSLPPFSSLSASPLPLTPPGGGDGVENASRKRNVPVLPLAEVRDNLVEDPDYYEVDEENENAETNLVGGGELSERKLAAPFRDSFTPVFDTDDFAKSSESGEPVLPIITPKLPVTSLLDLDPMVDRKAPPPPPPLSADNRPPPFQFTFLEAVPNRGSPLPILPTNPPPPPPPLPPAANNRLDRQVIDNSADFIPARFMPVAAVPPPDQLPVPAGGRIFRPQPTPPPFELPQPAERPDPPQNVPIQRENGPLAVQNVKQDGRGQQQFTHTKKQQEDRFLEQQQQPQPQPQQPQQKQNFDPPIKASRKEFRRCHGKCVQAFCLPIEDLTVYERCVEKCKKPCVKK